MPNEFCINNGCIVARYNSERRMYKLYRNYAYGANSPDVIIKNFFKAHRFMARVRFVEERLNKVGICKDCKVKQRFNT